MREGRCVSLIERLKQGSELKSTPSIGKLFQDSTIAVYGLIVDWTCHPTHSVMG